MSDAALLELRRLAAAVEAQACELADVRRLLERMVPPPLPPAQRALFDALAGEFGSGPMASRDVRASAKSPLKRHDGLRDALQQLRISADDVQAIGQALHSLTAATAGTWPRLVRCKDERGAGVWAIEGIGPA